MSSKLMSAWESHTILTKDGKSTCNIFKKLFTLFLTRWHKKKGYNHCFFPPMLAGCWLKGIVILKLLLCFLSSSIPIPDWAQAKTFTVNTTGDQSDPNAGNLGDDGACDVDPATPGDQCTCRAAIENHNGKRNLGQNQIKFDIPNAPGSGSIVIKVGSSGLGALPQVLGSVIIKAKNDPDGRRIEIDGSMAGSNAVGLKLLGGPCEISYFVINSFSSHGIFISGTPPPGSGGHLIKANYIGTDGTGKVAKANGGAGIYIDNTPNNTIGGTAFEEQNIISGNKGFGIVIHGSNPLVDFQTNAATNNMIKGNLIGLDIDGSLVVPNEEGGILDENAANNRIGDSTDVKAANKLAGVNYGIKIMGSLSEGVGIEGNIFQGDASAKFTAGIFGRGGKGLYITGNLLDKIDETAIDLFLDANGSYNIRKNRFEGTVKTGTKLRFGPGETIEIDYVNNFHTTTGLGIDAEESLNGKIDWNLLGNTLKAGEAGANMTFKAAGKKSFSDNSFEGMASYGLNFVTDLASGVQATLTQTNELFLKNGTDGVHGKIQGGGEFTYSILDSRMTGSGVSGTHLDVFVSAGAKVDIAALHNEYTVSGRAGLRVVSDGQKLDLVSFIFERNLVDHNNFFGIELFNSSIFKKSISNNTITNNGGPGIELDGNSEAHIDNNTITGNTTGILINDVSTGRLNLNTISGNGKGIAVAGSGTGIFVSNNFIFNNGIGFDLANDGVTANDIKDADTGPNNFQNFPILTAVSSTAGITNIQGTLNSTPNTTFRLEFFSNVQCSPSGNGEGQVFLGFNSVTTDIDGNGSFAFTFTGVPVANGSMITATATDPNNSTSEFSRCLLLGSASVFADLELTKAADKSTLTVGGSVSYKLNVTNNGPNPATGVQVTDKLPAGIDFVQAIQSAGSYDNSTGVWMIGNVAIGSTATLIITGTVTQVGTITNKAEVSASDQTDPDSSPANNIPTEDDQGSVSVTVLQQPVPIADLELIKAADKSTLTVGGSVSYKLNVTNNGPNPATGVQVTDKLPAGIDFVQAIQSAGSYDNSTGVWMIGNVAVGSTATLIITGTVTQVGTITNKAEVSASDQTDPDSSPANDIPTEDDQGSVSVTVLQQPAPIADLELSKVADKTTLTLGGSISYKITLTNKGPNTATGVQVNDKLPVGFGFGQAIASAGSYNNLSGVWMLGNVAVGSRATLIISGTVTQVGTITNKAEVSASDQPDPDSAPNNSNAAEDDQGTVTITVNTATASPAQEVQQLINTVNELIATGVVSAKDGKKLLNDLDNALKHINQDNTHAAINKLESFINQVQGFTQDGSISNIVGQQLIAAAQKIIALLARSQLVLTKEHRVSFSNDYLQEGGGREMLTNYPNPFKASTTIVITIQKESKTQLVVYDSRGIKVAALLDKVLPAGKHSVDWKPKSIASGIYFLRLQSNDHVKTLPISFLKMMY
jgi:uncharacterized repeat protein (TIGR01451 family)